MQETGRNDLRRIQRDVSLRKARAIVVEDAHTGVVCAAMQHILLKTTVVETTYRPQVDALLLGTTWSMFPSECATGFALVLRNGKSFSVLVLPELPHLPP